MTASYLLIPTWTKAIPALRHHRGTNCSQSPHKCLIRSPPESVKRIHSFSSCYNSINILNHSGLGRKLKPLLCKQYFIRRLLFYLKLGLLWSCSEREGSEQYRVYFGRISFFYSLNAYGYSKTKTQMELLCRHRDIKLCFIVLLRVKGTKRKILH
jgi:hypothetical protein